MASNKDKIKIGYTVQTQVENEFLSDCLVSYTVKVMALTPSITGNWAHRYDEFVKVKFFSQGFKLAAVEWDIANDPMGVSPVYVPNMPSQANMTSAQWVTVQDCFFKRADEYQVTGKLDRQGAQLLGLVSKALDRYTRWPWSPSDWRKVTTQSGKYIAAAMQVDTFTGFLAGLHSYGAKFVTPYSPLSDQGLVTKRGVSTSLDEVLDWQMQSRYALEFQTLKMLAGE